MCFSAEVSFTAGVVLLVTGSVCIAEATRTNRKYLLLSAFPFLFGIQQIIEGILWVRISATESVELPLLGFLFFSQFLWLIWAPLSVLKIEKNRHKRLICKICLLSGILLGAVFYIPTFISNSLYQVSVEQGSICYKHVLAITYPILKILLLPYAAIILTPLLTSSNIHVRTLGIMISISMLLTYIFYSYALVSVWCFFSAILSLYIAYFLRHTSHNQT